MKQIPQTTDALVLRTDFSSKEIWDTICEMIRAPVQDGDGDSDPFFANVEFCDDVEFGNLSKEELLGRLPPDYTHSFLLVVDTTTITSEGYPILVISLDAEIKGENFRAIPSQIQAIENNLSLANMDFQDFSDSAEEDGIFRGFPA